jgi:hypothetical protein
VIFDGRPGGRIGDDDRAGDPVRIQLQQTIDHRNPSDGHEQFRHRRMKPGAEPGGWNDQHPPRHAPADRR